jgi:hypothetical protein
MEPNDLLPLSQEPAYSLYPDLDESSPYHSIIFLLRPSLILSYT